SQPGGRRVCEVRRPFGLRRLVAAFAGKNGKKRRQVAALQRTQEDQPMFATTRRRFLLTAAAMAALLALQAFTPAFAQPDDKRPAEADRVHIVLLVAGADSNIGNADMADVEAMRHAVSTSFAGDKRRVVFHDLTGKNPTTGKHYTGPQIVQYLKTMKVGHNDTV